jgi:hypothetical protein
MRPTRQQPPEVASLLNPAVLALVLSRAAVAHYEVTGRGMHFVLYPIVVTMSLHPPSRAALTMNSATQFTSWIQRNPGLQIGLPELIVDMMPLAREGLLFGLAHDVLRLEQGTIAPGHVGPTKAVRGETSDVQDIQKAAAYLGRWFARSARPSVVCALLGVVP